ncbi:LysE family translocator [Paraburkholderia sp. BCC1886]|uniref:LysE family translocator n=1 Tax=Paraburkholderia sp. BCC1886 TaxID=2562670 RepID=UPI0016433A86|nr:LysE family translocator [Paraburkholderia sp. BCC1886]
MLASPLMSFALASFACTLSPGPNAMLVIRNTASFGARAIFPTLAGQLTARLLLGLAVALGLSALLLANPSMANTLKLAGAAYLGYIGLKALSARGTPSAIQPVQVAAPRTGTPRALAMEAALVSGLNPNTLAFLAAALPQVLTTGLPMANQLPAILFIDETALLVVMSSYSMLTCVVASRLAHGKWRLQLKRAGGAVMLLFAAGTLSSMA